LFGGWAPPRPAGELTALPQTPWLSWGATSKVERDRAGRDKGEEE